MTSNPSNQRSYLDVRVTLSRTRPRIQRRFLLRESASLAELARACQEAVGLLGSHDWERSTDWHAERGVTHEDPEPREDGGRRRLRDYFTADAGGNPTIRLHDFTEGWDLVVTLRGTVREADGFRRKLLSGEGAAPLLDCGGPNGHKACVALVRGRACHEDRNARDFVRWVGDWDPDAFDLEKAREDFDR